MTDQTTTAPFPTLGIPEGYAFAVYRDLPAGTRYRLPDDMNENRDAIAGDPDDEDPGLVGPWTIVLARTIPPVTVTSWRSPQRTMVEQGDPYNANVRMQTREDAAALDQLAVVMSAPEWTPGTLDQVAGIVWTVRERVAGAPEAAR